MGGHAKIMKQTLNTHACSLAREEAGAVLSVDRKSSGRISGGWRGGGVLSGARGKATAQHVGSQYSGRDRKLQPRFQASPVPCAF